MNHFVDNSPMDPLPNDMWEQSPSLESMLMSPSVSSSSTTNNQACTPTGLTTSSNETTMSNASYNHALSENAIESVKRQQNQNKLIHLDPIPDFNDKNEIKPWLQKIFYPQGIEIVIERSDNIKIIFKCKASKRGKKTRKSAFCGPDDPGNEDEKSLLVQSLTKSNNNSTSSSNSTKKKRSVSPYNTCPFRIRATFSLKRQKWNIVVINNGHSHPLKFNPESEDYKKFKNKLREDGDWDAVKKFDELEYRTKFNLPTEPTPISCDCGLTQEIESFNVILPSVNAQLPSLPSQNACTANSTDKTVAKPKKNLAKKSRKSITATGSSGSNNTRSFKRKSTKDLLTHDIQSNTSTSTTRTTTPMNASLQNPFTSTSFIDGNEIDFTEFLKPLPHFKHLHGQADTGNSVPPTHHSNNWSQPAPAQQWSLNNQVSSPVTQTMHPQGPIDFMMFGQHQSISPDLQSPVHMTNSGSVHTQTHSHAPSSQNLPDFMSFISEHQQPLNFQHVPQHQQQLQQHRNVSIDDLDRTSVSVTATPMCEVNNSHTCQSDCMELESTNAVNAQQNLPHNLTQVVDTQNQAQDQNTLIGSVLNTELSNMRIIDGHLHVVEEERNTVEPENLTKNTSDQQSNLFPWDGTQGFFG